MHSKIEEEQNKTGNEQIKYICLLSLNSIPMNYNAP